MAAGAPNEPISTEDASHVDDGECMDSVSGIPGQLSMADLDKRFDNELRLKRITWFGLLILTACTGSVGAWLWEEEHLWFLGGPLVVIALFTFYRCTKFLYPGS